MESLKQNRKVFCPGIFYFLAITAATTLGVLFTLKEGRRIKQENELLSYEVW
ncbi:MAG: hypothetical protein ABI123_07025 [Ginsengibacter sp.]|jgi:hypothetical protein